MASSHRFCTPSSHVIKFSQSISRNNCHQCRIHYGRYAQRKRSLPPPVSHVQAQRFASNGDFEKSFAGRVRRKLWGTDTPPGQANPYVRETPEETEDRLEEEREQELILREQEEIKRLGGTLASNLSDNQEAEDYENPEDEPLEEQPPPGYVPATNWRYMRHIPNPKIAASISSPVFNG